MPKYTPTKEEFYILKDHNYNPNILSFDQIATEFYGKEYVSQQTGDYIAHDSILRYDMETDDDCEDWRGNLHQERTYLGYDSVKKETIYREGVSPLNYWLSLSHSNDQSKVTHPGNPKPGEDCFGQVFAYDFQVYREAPEPAGVLADLIYNKVLPKGKYLLFIA